MFGIDQQVQQTADAYRGKPEMLQQKYAQNQQLIDLLALQKLKSDKEEASRQMALSMQGKPPTIADQRESQVLEMTTQEVAKEQAGVMRQRALQMQDAQKKALQAAGAPSSMPQPQQPPSAGLAGLPAPNIQGMAGGGIVAFDQGGTTGEAEAQAAMEQRRQQRPQGQQERRAQNDLQAGLARLQQMNPDAIRNQIQEEATAAANFNAAERAAKQRAIDERSAAYDTNKLARILMGMGGYSSPALAIQGGGATAVNDADRAMRERLGAEDALINMGPASRMAGQKAGETAYGHAMPGLISGVREGVNLAQVGESASARLQAAKTLAEQKTNAAERIDETRRLEILRIRLKNINDSIDKQMKDSMIEPGSSGAQRFEDAREARSQQAYMELGLSNFISNVPRIAAPEADPKKSSGFLSGVKGILGLNPSVPPKVIDFNQVQRRNP